MSPSPKKGYQTTMAQGMSLLSNSQMSAHFGPSQKAPPDERSPPFPTQAGIPSPLKEWPHTTTSCFQLPSELPRA